MRRRVRWTRQKSAAESVPLAVGGMLGAGVYLGIAPAAALAGAWFLVGVVLAALTAACCGLPLVDQRATYSAPGPGYACVRAKLGLVAGRAAASTYLVGQLAAMAAIADTAGNYLPSPQPLTAVAMLLLLVLAATTGLRMGRVAAWLWLLLGLAMLAVVVAASLAIAPVESAVPAPMSPHNPLGITAAAGLLLFAFLGFERFSRTITPYASQDERRAGRRGIVVAVAVVAAITLAVGAAALRQLGAVRLGASPHPLTDVLRAADAANLTSLVAVGLALTLLPVLLGALEAFRETGRAVIRKGDLPAAIGRMGRHGTPYLLDLAGGLAAAGLTLLLRPAQAIALAVCCLLVHYALSNTAVVVNQGAQVLPADGGRLTRVAYAGIVLTALLALSMPGVSLLWTLVAAVLGPVGAGLYTRRWG